MTFGQRLQVLRRKAGMSQDALAEKLEVSRQAVSKWERDEAMPETDKVIRIARLFGVSLDSLLLGREEGKTQEEPPRQPETEHQPQHQPPRYQPTGIPGDRVEQFIRRHGYKAGYVMSAAGAVLCVLSLVMYLVWPAIGNAFFGGITDSFDDPFGMMGSYDIQIEGDISPEMEALIREELTGGDAYGFGTVGGFWNSATSSMQSITNNALRAQAVLFLLPMIPGLLLIAAGIFIIIKGKKLASRPA